jgi:hypothetical protein
VGWFNGELDSSLPFNDIELVPVQKEYRLSENGAHIVGIELTESNNGRLVVFNGAKCQPGVTAESDLAWNFKPAWDQVAFASVIRHLTRLS